MTSEVRTLIEFTDIIGIEFECPKCAAKILYPLDKHYDRLLSLCPNCDQTWFDTNDRIHPAEPQVIDQVTNLIAHFRKLVARTDIHAHVRIQVKNEQEI
jgi:hypothetical protein